MFLHRSVNECGTIKQLLRTSQAPEVRLSVQESAGGNLDVGLLPNLIRRHETGAGRRLVIVVRIPDRPGALAGVLQVCGAFGANVIEVQHHRDGVELHARETIVQLVLETHGIGHSTALCDELVARGYGVSADLPRGNSPHSAER